MSCELGVRRARRRVRLPLITFRFPLFTLHSSTHCSWRCKKLPLRTGRPGGGAGRSGLGEAANRPGGALLHVATGSGPGQPRRVAAEVLDAVEHDLQDVLEVMRERARVFLAVLVVIGRLQQLGRPVVVTVVEDT